jgi:hypothetical protein
MRSANCLNCQTPLPEEQHFCAQCGQKADTHAISLHEITHDAVHYFTHADKGIFHLIKGLAIHPGKVAREYIEGRRKTYFKPLNWFLIVAGIVVFMTSTFHMEGVRHSDKRPAQASAVQYTPEQIKGFAEMSKRVAQVSKVTDKYSNFLTMLATPLLTLFLWLFYLRGRYTYLEHLVANMYFSPFVMLFYALVFVPLQRLSANTMYSSLVLGVFFLFEFIYRGIAYYQFMGKKGRIYLFKALGFALLTSVIWFSISAGLIYYYIRYGF